MRAQLGGALHGLVAAARLTDDLQPVLGVEQAAQAGTEEVVVVDDHDAQGRVAG